MPSWIVLSSYVAGGRAVADPIAALGTLLARGLDRSSPVPLYHQVAQLLRTAIADGTLPPGSRLENEIALAERLRLSRPTIRQALQDLVDAGLLVRRRGVGTQVVHPHVNRSMALTSLHDDLVDAGQHPSTELLDYRIDVPGDEVAEAMGLARGAAVLTMRRLRSADGEPLALMTNYVLLAVAPDREALVSRGLYECLRERGVNLRVARQRIGARLAGATEARLLDERPRAALVTIERTAYDDGGRVVEHGQHVYRASRYHVESTLVER